VLTTEKYVWSLGWTAILTVGCTLLSITLTICTAYPLIYTNLKGGTYRFTISLINEDTGEAEKTATIVIVKDMAFYETYWFSILVAVVTLLLLALAGWLFYHKKTAAFREKQRTNRELINQMTRVFSDCVDMKDAYTNGHSARVAEYSAMFARKMGKSEEEVERIRNIALLHDIGKISIPDNILNKPGRLDDAEFAVMKTHSSRGYEILKDIAIDPDIALGAGYHHEKFDGSGYPSGLKGDEIPEVAQIIAVADAFDAMYSTRPYRTKMPLEKVVAEIKRCTGTQFSPKVFEAFLKLVDEGVFNDPETPGAPTAGENS
ncbi:MAG: HD-GYP domain-containing protein, partial [Clostridia bacterium]|nr:HD-GYP domain-containing protein [Clostridia bacterium]